MTELQEILIGAGAAAEPRHVVDGLTDELVHRKPAGAPHSIYEELWHVTFWLRMSLDWVQGKPTPYPASAVDGFPTVLDMEREDWMALRTRFLNDLQEAAEIAGDERALEVVVECPSKPGVATRHMTAREQLENAAAHDAYHMGRIVLLRQMLGVWPPAGGGYTW
ncbi:MAG: DinB family protein [Acidobacteriota bacterium]|nr:DinB family protein [Acidobacteriota bacterium]